uniref:Uncharacterized protein n=1 Tax=Glossina brevipalpis TaxID=37001 RepID=A0A1A9WUL8_9MUSC
MDIDSTAITIPVIDTPSIGTNAVSVNQSNNNANRLNNSGSSSSSISSNSSGYGSTTTTPTNNYETQSAPTTPVAIPEPLPNATIATVTPFINEAAITKVFNQQQEQQQTLQQHTPHLQKQQHHHHYHFQYKQRQSPLTSATLPTRQQYYNAYDYHQQSHNLAATQAVGASSPFTVGSGIESYENMVSYAGAASYKKSSDINYERDVNLKSTQIFYDNKPMTHLQQQEQHQQQFVGISNVQEKQGHFLNQRSSNISFINNTNTNNSHKPQAAATPFYAQPFPQQYSCSSYYDNFHTKAPMTLSEYQENYDQSYQQHKFYAAAKTQIKEAAGLTKPYSTGSHTAQSFYSSNTTNHALTPPAYDKYLYSPNSLSTGGYHTSRIGNETPPEAKAYRKNSGNSSTWQWPLDNLSTTTRPLPPSSALQQPTMASAGHIPTATVAPTHAGSYLAQNPANLQREATYYYRNTTAAYQSPSLIHASYQPQPYMSPPPANRNLWHTSHALHNERLSHSVQQNGVETANSPHATIHSAPYFPTNSSIASNNRQACCSQAFSPQNCYYPSRLTVPPPPPMALRSTSTYIPPQQASSPHLTSLGSSCKYGSVQDFTVNNKMKNPTDLFVGSTTYETQPSHGLHAHNYNYSAPVNGNTPFLSPSNQHQSTLTTGFTGPTMAQNQSIYPNDLNIPSNNFSSYLPNPLNRETSYMNNHNMEPTFGPTSTKSALLDYRKHLQTPSQSQSQHQPLATDDFYLNASRDHIQSADSSKALGNGETSLFQFDIEQQGTVNITFNPSNEVNGPYVNEDKASCDDVNKNLSLRDFIANWNDDEEDCAASEQVIANNSNHVMTKPTEPAGCDMSISRDTENSEKPPPEKSLNEEKTSADSGLLIDNITTDLDASNQYINLPDIIIDIEKSTNTINNAHPENSKLQLNLDNFDVEQELDQLQLKKYGNNTEAESSITLSENCEHILTEKTKDLNVNDNSGIQNKDHNLDNKELANNVLSSAKTCPLSNDIEHRVEQQFFNDIEPYDSSNSHHSNESAFEKEYETFINRISNEISAKEFKCQESSDQEFEQNVKDFSKFYKRKRKLKQLEDEDMKKGQVSKQQKIHPQSEIKDNSNFPQVYTRKSRFRKSKTKSKLRRKRKPASIFYRLMHSLKRSFSFHNSEPIHRYLNELRNTYLPLTKKKLPQALNVMKTRTKLNTLKVLCVMAVNTNEFRATLAKSVNSKLGEATVPLNENLQSSLGLVYRTETTNPDVANEEHICTDPQCETCEVIKSLMEPQPFEFNVQTNQNLSEPALSCDIEPIDLSSESCFRENLKTNSETLIENEYCVYQNSQKNSESNTVIKLDESNVESEVHEHIIETQGAVKITNESMSIFLDLKELQADIAEHKAEPIKNHISNKTLECKKAEKCLVVNEFPSEVGDEVTSIMDDPICKNDQQNKKCCQTTSFLNIDKKINISNKSNESTFEKCNSPDSNADGNRTDFVRNAADENPFENLRCPLFHEERDDKLSPESQHLENSYQCVQGIDSKKSQQKLERNVATSNYWSDSEIDRDKKSDGPLLCFSNIGVFSARLEKTKESEKSISNEPENGVPKADSNHCEPRLRMSNNGMENYEKIMNNLESTTSGTTDCESGSSCSSLYSNDDYENVRECQTTDRDESVKEKGSNGNKDQASLASIGNTKHSEIESDNERPDVSTPKERNLYQSSESDEDSPVSATLNDDAESPIIRNEIKSGANSFKAMENSNDCDEPNIINISAAAKDNACHSTESNFSYSEYGSIYAEENNQKLVKKNKIDLYKGSNEEQIFEIGNGKPHVKISKEDNSPQYVESDIGLTRCTPNPHLMKENITSYSETEVSKCQSIKEDNLSQPGESDHDASICNSVYNKENNLIKQKLDKNKENEMNDEESRISSHNMENMTPFVQNADDASICNATCTQDLFETKNKSPPHVDGPKRNESVYKESELDKRNEDNLSELGGTDDRSNKNRQTTEEGNERVHVKLGDGVALENTYSKFHIHLAPEVDCFVGTSAYDQKKPEGMLKNTDKESNKMIYTDFVLQPDEEKAHKNNCEEVIIDIPDDLNLLQYEKNDNALTLCGSVNHEELCQKFAKERDLSTSNDSSEGSESESNSEYCSSDEDAGENANKDLKPKTVLRDSPSKANSEGNTTDFQSFIFENDSSQHPVGSGKITTDIQLLPVGITEKLVPNVGVEDFGNKGFEDKIKLNVSDNVKSNISFNNDTDFFTTPNENRATQEQAQNSGILTSRYEESENSHDKLHVFSPSENETGEEKVSLNFTENKRDSINFEGQVNHNEYLKNLDSKNNTQTQSNYVKMSPESVPVTISTSIASRDYIHDGHHKILFCKTELEQNISCEAREGITLSQTKSIPELSDEFKNLGDHIEVSESIPEVSKERDPAIAMKNADQKPVTKLAEKEIINSRKISLLKICKELLANHNELIEQNLIRKKTSDVNVHLQCKEEQTDETLLKCTNTKEVKGENLKLDNLICSDNDIPLQRNVDPSGICFSEGNNQHQFQQKQIVNTTKYTKETGGDSSTAINLNNFLPDNRRLEDTGSNESMVEDFKGFTDAKYFEEESQDFKGFDDKTSSDSNCAINFEENGSLSSSCSSTIRSSKSLRSFRSIKFLHENFKNSVSSELNDLEALEEELMHNDLSLQSAEDKEKQTKQISSQLIADKIMSTNHIEHVKMILECDEVSPKETREKNADVTFVSKLSDLCRNALNSSLHLPNVRTTFEQNPVDENEEKVESPKVLLGRELTVEEALADMYRQAGILSDSEDSANEPALASEDKELDDGNTEPQDVILINLQEILNSDNDIYVLQCDLNENILNIMETSTTSPTQQQQHQTAHIDENITERVNALLATQTESEIHIISSDSECEEVILLSDEGESEIIPFITDHNLADENVSLIHHEEIVPDNYKEFLREEFFKYLHEKYVQKNISKYYHANRILRKYKKRYSKQKK